MQLMTFQYFKRYSTQDPLVLKATILTLLYVLFDLSRQPIDFTLALQYFKHLAIHFHDLSDLRRLHHKGGGPNEDAYYQIVSRTNLGLERTHGHLYHSYVTVSILQSLRKVLF